MAFGTSSMSLTHDSARRCQTNFCDKFAAVILHLSAKERLNRCSAPVSLLVRCVLVILGDSLDWSFLLLNLENTAYP